jgi:hypothetical protein
LTARGRAIRSSAGFGNKRAAAYCVEGASQRGCVALREGAPGGGLLLWRGSCSYCCVAAQDLLPARQALSWRHAESARAMAATARTVTAPQSPSARRLPPRQRRQPAAQPLVLNGGASSWACRLPQFGAVPPPSERKTHHVFARRQQRAHIGNAAPTARIRSDESSALARNFQPRRSRCAPEWLRPRVH